MEINDVIEKGSAFFGVSIDQLRSKTRKREVVLPRQSIATACKLLCNCSLKEVGLQLGGRDHSTILHSIANIENWEHDPSMRKHYKAYSDFVFSLENEEDLMFDKFSKCCLALAAGKDG